MSDNRFMMLQFFADGAAGGDGGEGAASTGDNAADAGRDLEALGVPREYAERHRQRTEKKRAAAPANTQPQNQSTEDAPQETQNEEEEARKEWDAFMSKDVHKSHLQQMMAERGKAATEAKRAADAKMESLGPALELLGDLLGLDPDADGGYNLDNVIKEATKRRFEDKAMENGVSVEVQQQLEKAKQMEKAEEEAKRKAELQEHFNRQLEASKPILKYVPGFNFEQELNKDPEFVRLTAPGIGLPADKAYMGLHYEEILKQQAANITQRSKQAAAANVAAGGSRPRENGSAAMATASATPDMRAMTPQERRAYIMRKYPKRT